MTASHMWAVSARVETINPGDAILLGGFLGWREVLDVLEYPPDLFVVVYRDTHLHGWDFGHPVTTHGHYEKSLRPLREGERWPVVRAS